MSDYTPDYSVLQTYPISAWEWPKPVVFIPWMQALPYADQVLPNFIEIARTGVPFIHLQYGYAERVLNLAVWEFLDSSFTHMIVLDSDHTHQPDIVHQLCRLVIEDPSRQIVGGLNYRRSAPYGPCALLDVDGKLARPVEWEPTDTLQEVAAIGTANIIFDRKVFEQVPPPWFINEYSEELRTTGGYDTYFGNKARAHGFKIWCDFSLCSPHMGSHRISEKTYRTYMAMHPIPQEELVNVKMAR